MTGDKRPDLSIVAPFYNEEDVIPLFLTRLYEALASLEGAIEIVLVDDGSTDRSPDLLIAASQSDARVCAVILSRNFGHQQAVSAGMGAARGDRVVIMDGDLQDPPEFVPRLLEKMDEGYDVVYAVRRAREETLVKRIAYRLFYRLLKKASSFELPLDTGDFAILSRRVVDIMVQMPETQRYLRGLRAYSGFRQTGLEYDRPTRAAGKTKYSLRKLMLLAADGIFSFSATPVRAASVLGLVVALFSFLYAAYLVVWRLMYGDVIPGFATLAVAIFFVGGVQLLFLGVVGEYVGRIYNEVRRRPGFIVASVHGAAAEHIDKRLRELGKPR